MVVNFLIACILFTQRPPLHLSSSVNITTSRCRSQCWNHVRASTRDYKPEKAESRRQKAEGRKQKAEGKSRRQKAEGRKQKAESRSQNAVVRRQRSEGRQQLLYQAVAEGLCDGFALGVDL